MLQLAKSFATSETSSPREASDRIGPYRLCFEIAAGGMATVHLALVELAGVERTVALKRLHPQLQHDPVFVEMFLDEARFAAQIRHPNVCSVLDFGCADGSYYLAMEYLSGETLSRVRRALLRRAPLEPARLAALAARIISDAAEGVHAAHELRDASGRPLDVVHRDVSPDNIFLTEDGVVKLVDFGIARGSRQQHKTRTGVIKGKYAYIQPEVLQGAKVDRRADVWGLGVVLWELLTLKRLFHRRTDIATLRAVLDERIPPPSELNPGLPPALDEIVLRALARDPGARPATARALAKELNRFLARQDEPAGLADLAELMGDLFPGARGEDHEIMRAAERFDAGEKTPSSMATRIRGPGARRPVGDRARRVAATFAASVALGFAVFMALRFGHRAMTQREQADVPPVARPAVSSSETAQSVRLGSGPYVFELAPAEDGVPGAIVLRIDAAEAAPARASSREPPLASRQER